MITNHTPSTAEALLADLGPLDKTWEQRPDRWIFRGHGDARWSLLPTAYRADGWKRFRWPDREPHRPQPNGSAIVQGQEESEILSRFYHALNDAGHAIPGDGEELFSAIDRLPQDATDPLPSCVYPLLALARHSGIPTRLLDWSRQPKVAAYFAAAEAARRCGDPDLEASKKPTNFEVWAFQLDFIMRHGAGNNLPQLAIVRPPQASNPNLNAQAGVCTVHSGDHLGRIATFDEIVQHVMQHWPEDRGPIELPVFHRFTVPATEAGKLLRLLSYDGITGARIFPGHAGVVLSLEEQGYWDQPRAGRTFGRVKV